MRHSRPNIVAVVSDGVPRLVPQLVMNALRAHFTVSPVEATEDRLAERIVQARSLYRPNILFIYSHLITVDGLAVLRLMRWDANTPNQSADLDQATIDERRTDIRVQELVDRLVPLNPYFSLAVLACCGGLSAAKDLRSIADKVIAHGGTPNSDHVQTLINLLHSRPTDQLPTTIPGGFQTITGRPVQPRRHWLRSALGTMGTAVAGGAFGGYLMHQCGHGKIVRIGVSSRVRRALVEYLASREVELMKECGAIPIVIPVSYPQARNGFSDALYDVVMLDEPWLPDYLSKGILAEIEPPNRDALVAPSTADLGIKNAQTFARPWMANIQVFITNVDKLSKGATRMVKDADELRMALGGEPRTFRAAYRTENSNDLVEAFLHFYRLCAGSVEEVRGSKLAFDRVKVQAALALMEELDPQRNSLLQTRTAEEALGRVLAPNDSVACCVGWPSWVLTSLGGHAIVSPSNLSIVASPAPVRGFWFLAAKKASPVLPEALRLIQYLCKAVVQKSLVDEQTGYLPVDAVLYEAGSSSSKFFGEHAMILKGAIHEARPRVAPPGTTWQQCETKLGDNVRRTLESKGHVLDTDSVVELI